MLGYTIEGCIVTESYNRREHMVFLDFARYGVPVGARRSVYIYWWDEDSCVGKITLKVEISKRKMVFPFSGSMRWWSSLSCCSTIPAAKARENTKGHWNSPGSAFVMSYIDSWEVVHSANTPPCPLLKTSLVHIY